ncbi:MAG: DUF4886 domain-containing protein [Akkermansiaceae bacterium]
MLLRRNLILSLFSLYLGVSASAEPAEKILFIGNSYTGGVRKMVTELVQQSPHANAQISFINPGGKTLEFHLKNKATVEKIETGKFDIVVLQDQSQFPAVFPDRFQKAAVALHKIIKRSGATTVFYETWGRRDGDKMNKKLFPNFESMQKALSKSYQSTAKKCRANLAPVGSTWSIVREKNPKLGRDLYRGDGSHPSPKGSYLAACVFYATLFDKDPRKLKFTGGLPEDEAKLIREVAYSTVTNA